MNHCNRYRSDCRIIKPHIVAKYAVPPILIERNKRDNSTLNDSRDKFDSDISEIKPLKTHEATQAQKAERTVNFSNAARKRKTEMSGADCDISYDTVIEKTIIWSRVHIGEKATVKNCIIGSENSINSSTHIENIVIGHNETKQLKTDT